MTTVGGGVYIRPKGSFGTCDGNLRVQVWHLAVETPDIVDDLAMGLAAAHVPPQAPFAHPNARIADRLACNARRTQQGLLRDDGGRG